MLEATSQELRKACLRNAKAAGALQGAHGSCRGILVFYSVECGLKSLIMDDRGEKSSKTVGPKFGHNIRSLIAEARISAAELGLVANAAISIPTIRHGSGGQEISFSDVHTAWRYGVSLEAAGELAATAFLDSLVSALRKRLTT
ncbi:hypothetical protein [Methylorubrum podarium]|uniref:hypothetical protein n=1 Tax=Methylorubrum podarium TaxID=200476 RepID=UPI001EE2A823|nr:hypothetical protein [Methylorubrum podarium]